MAWHTLIPFPGTVLPSDWRVKAQVLRDSRELTLEFAITAVNDELHWPAARQNRKRCDELWTSTCLELFLAIENQSEYWEVNASPCGDWNVYHLDDYRQGLTAEPSIDSMGVSTNVEGQLHRLTASLQLPEAVSAETPLKASLCAVLQRGNNQNSYWAMTHPRSQADFHAREGFVLTI